MSSSQGVAIPRGESDLRDIRGTWGGGDGVCGASVVFRWDNRVSCTVSDALQLSLLLCGDTDNERRGDAVVVPVAPTVEWSRRLDPTLWVNRCIDASVGLSGDDERGGYPRLVLTFGFVCCLFVLSVLDSHLPDLHRPGLGVISLARPNMGKRVSRMCNALCKFVTRVFADGAPGPEAVPWGPIVPPVVVGGGLGARAN